MPPKQKFQKEEIVAAAVNLVRAHGVEALTARALGEALHSSARPIFTVFDSMAEVRKAVEDAAYGIYSRYIENGLAEAESFKGSGKAYIRFGRDEPNLFRLLFMTGTPNPAQFSEVLPYVDSLCNNITDAAKAKFHIDRETARRLHHHLWIYCHGIAVFQATGVCKFSDEEIDRMLTEVGGSLYRNIKE